MIEGVYWLVLHNSKAQTIRIGALGDLAFEEGFYVYVGSAMMPKNHTTNALFNRVIRHCRPKTMKKKHWHIDYLMAATMVNLQRIYLLPSHDHEECIWAEFVKTQADGQISRFGCSDCNCVSHLFYFQGEPFQT